MKRTRKRPVEKLKTAKDMQLAVLIMLGVRMRNEARRQMRDSSEDNGVRHRERMILMRDLFEAVQRLPVEDNKTNGGTRH